MGPRGIGKSSILYALSLQAESRLDPPRKALYLDLQHISDEGDFFAALCDLMQVPAIRGFRLARAIRDKRFLLILDEVEKMTWKGFTHEVRSHLRGLAEGSGAPLRLVLAARTSLDTLFQDSEQCHAVSPLANICMEVHIGPWSTDVIRQFIRLSLERTGVVFSERDIEDIAVRSEGYPQLVMRLSHEKYDLHSGRG
jgi:type II secretory pathway predicted ATPase ExeA